MPTSVRADDVTAKASVTDTNVETGQSVDYQIQITGGQLSRAPTVPRVDGLSMTYAGESQQTTLQNNGGGFQLTSTSTYTFNVETERAGRFVIPGQELTVGKRTVQIPAVALNVTGSAAGNGAVPGRNAGQQAFARVVFPKKTVYVGEAVPVELRVYLGARLHFQADQNPILGGDGFSAQKFTTPQLETETLEGTPYNVIKYKTSVTALKTGELTFGPVQVEPVIQRPSNRVQRRSSNNPFNDPFFNDPFGAFTGETYVTKQEKLQSEPLKIQVQPLPAGAPEDFNGAIGQFKLDVAAQGNPHKVKAGDPVTLEAIVRGTGNFDRLTAPLLTDDSGLQTYPANGKFKDDEEVHLSGTKTFEQVIIPRSNRETLPGYRLVYFDPDKVKYVTLDSPRLAVKVEGAEPTPAPVVSQTAAGSPMAGTPAATPTPTLKSEDILYIRADQGRLVSGEIFVPLVQRRIFWLAQLFPLAGLTLLIALHWRKEHARDEARRRLAERIRLQGELVRTLEGEKTGRRDFYSAATRLAQLKAVDGVNADLDRLTAEEVSRAKSLDPQTATSLAEIFHRFDQISYGGERAAQEPVPVHERKDVLATVGKL